MRIPKEVKVGPHSYLVKFNKMLRYDEGNYGNNSRRTQVVEIDPILPPSEMDVVFWHEVIHVIDRNFSLGLSEERIDNLAVGLTQFLDDNFRETLNWEDIN